MGKGKTTEDTMDGVEEEEETTTTPAAPVPEKPAGQGSGEDTGEGVKD